MARTGLMKKYIDLAKKAGASNIFKKAWALQKKARAATKRKVTKLKGVKKTKKPTTKKGVQKMTAKKKGGGNPKKKRPRRRVGLISQTTINALMTGTLVAVPALGGVWIINQIPWVKDQRPWIKASIQAGLGITGLTLLRGAMMKKLSSGVIAGGMMQLVFPYIPGLKFGAGRRLTTSELAALQTGKGYRWSGAAKWPGNNSMGKPETVIAGRGRQSNR